MDNSEVAIQTDTAQETNTNVHVLVEQEATELTQPLSVTPVIVLKRHAWDKSCGKKLDYHVVNER